MENVIGGPSAHQSRLENGPQRRCVKAKFHAVILNSHTLAGIRRLLQARAGNGLVDPIPNYNPTKRESADRLSLIHVDRTGTVTWLEGSGYDNGKREGRFSPDGA